MNEVKDIQFGDESIPHKVLGRFGDWLALEAIYTPSWMWVMQESTGNTGVLEPYVAFLHEDDTVAWAKTLHDLSGKFTGQELAEQVGRAWYHFVRAMGTKEHRAVNMQGFVVYVSVQSVFDFLLTGGVV